MTRVGDYGQTARRAARRARNGVLAACGLALVSSAAFGQATTRAAFVANNGNLEGSVTSFVFDDDGAPVFVQKVITGERPSTTV